MCGFINQYQVTWIRNFFFKINSLLEKFKTKNISEFLGFYLSIILNHLFALNKINSYRNKNKFSLIFNSFSNFFSIIIRIREFS
jgi:hypothetical protein